jgi:hypothetical protein
MKSFLVKGICFAAPLLLVAGYFELELRRIPTSYSIKRAQLDSVVDQIEVLVVGPSHTEQGLFPRMLRRRAYSLAFGGQDLYYDDQLVERTVARAPKLKLVLITVSFISLEYRMFDGIEPWRTHFYSLFLGLPNESWKLGLTLEDKSLLALYGPEKALEYARQGFKLDLSGGELNDDGSRNVRARLAAAATASNGQSRFALDRRDIMHASHFEENRMLLERLLHRLQARGVVPVIVTLPVLPDYAAPARATESWRRMQDALAALCQKYGVHYFNYFDDRRFSVTDFANSDHLNDQGAVKFSRIVDDEIIAGLLH